MKELQSLEKSFESLYHQFMQVMNIDEKTGVVRQEGTPQGEQELRFGGYPYIGSYYPQAKKKILFVGLDLGYDENMNDNSYHTLSSRRECISFTACGFSQLSANPFNAHMSGTYAFSLAALKDECGWQEAWKLLSADSQRLTKTIINENYNKLPVDVLDYVALTNLFKFVTVNRKNRTGDSNRKWEKKDVEMDLLSQEIEILNPDVIILQGSGKYLPSSILNYLKSKHILIDVHHPSAWRNGENKIGYVKQILNV